jgi:hypothetical protein
MAAHMERVLGAKIGRDETILWGLGEGEDPDKVRLVALPTEGGRANNFSRVTQAVVPPHLSNGGCVLQDDLLTPDGDRFAVLTYHGDVEGWQQQIEEGASLLGFKSAKISGNRLIVSDGRSFAVADCKLERS